MAENYADFGVVNLTVHEGRNLPAGDIDGRSDPYAQVCLELQKVKTKYKDATLNPVWEESFALTVTKHNSPLIVEIFDKDIARDDSLGRFEVNLHEYKDKPATDKWFPVHTPSGQKGEVRMTIRFNTISFLFERIKKYEEQEARLNADLKKVQEEKDELANALNAANAEKDQLATALNAANEELARERGEKERATIKITELTTIIETLEQEKVKIINEKEQIISGNQNQLNNLQEENRKLKAEIENLRHKPAPAPATAPSKSSESHKFWFVLVPLLLIIAILLGLLYHQHESPLCHQFSSLKDLQ